MSSTQDYLQSEQIDFRQESSDRPPQLNPTVVGRESGHADMSLEASNVDGRRTILVLLQGASSTASSPTEGSSPNGPEAFIALEIRITSRLDEHQYQMVQNLGFRPAADGHGTNAGRLVATGYGVFERNDASGVYDCEHPEGFSFHGLTVEQLLYGIGTGAGRAFDTHTDGEGVASPYQQTLDME